MKKNIILTLIVAVLGISNGFGWGQKGHDTVCTIAQRHLSENAKNEISKLLDGKSIIYWANWLDDASNTPAYAYSKTWHYKNIDAADTYETASLEPKGDVVRAVEAQIEILKNDTMSREDRQLALKMLIHLVGDMHQPLHMGHKTDIGGNRWPVTFFREQTQIHRLWDTQLLERCHVWSHTEWAEEVDRLTEDEQKAICEGTPNDWAKETYEVCKEVYAGTPESSELSYGYMSKWTPTVEMQLEKAGVRLAYILNKIW